MKDSVEYEMLQLFEMTPDLVCITGKDGFFRKVNPAVISTLGYSESELLSKPVAGFIHPEDRDRTAGVREKLLQGSALLNFQNRYCTKNGEVVWLEWTSIYIPEKEVVFAIAKDITSGKLLEKNVEQQYLKFKGLANHFKLSMEKDRQNVALELHEQLAQLATVIKLDVELLKGSFVGTGKTVPDRLEHAYATTEELLETIRRISFDVSPNMLDEIGLEEAMRWHCKEFSKLNGISCNYVSIDLPQDIDGELQLDVFRICQERLNLLTKHTKASAVAIRLEQIAGFLRITIADDTNEREEDILHSLNSILKRVSSAEGQLLVKQGEQTIVEVLLPLSTKSKL